MGYIASGQNALKICYKVVKSVCDLMVIHTIFKTIMLFYRQNLKDYKLLLNQRE